MGSCCEDESGCVMIDWQTSLQRHQIQSLADCRVRKSKICVKCDNCGLIWDKVFRSSMRLKIEKDGYYVLCQKCLHQDPQYLDKLRQASCDLWNDSDYVNRNLAAVNSPDNIHKLCERAKQLHVDGVFDDAYQLASQRTKELWQCPKFRTLITQSSKSLWDNVELVQQMLASRRTNEYIENQRQLAIERMSNQAVRDRIAMAMRKHWENPESAKQHKSIRVSALQHTLYSILDDLQIVYYREYDDKPDDSQCQIGPYSFDCVIPRCGQSTLLIECNGEYWHGDARTQAKDSAKATYVSKYFPDYELRQLWEHEFKERNKIKDLLQYWTGTIAPSLIDVSFDDVCVVDDPAPADYRLLLSKYHYLHTAGRGGIVYGAYFDKILIAVAVFSPPIRQNRDAKNTRELSRFCIHPRYQHKNLASWFISRCLKRLPPQYKTIIAFSDTTFGHTGTIYKASNFVVDGVVKADYWYVAADGWVIHKKTLYNQAVKMGMIESEYAALHGYIKSWGKNKIRFLYNR